MKPFKTERLVIICLNIKDLDAVMNFWGNSEVMKYCGGSSNDRNRIGNAISNYINSQNERGFSAFAVVLQENNEIIGACGFNYTKNKDEIELIYHFTKEYWGKGYATEAAKGCIEYASENLSGYRVIASIDPRHEASCNVLNKLGFKYIGIKWADDTKQEELYYELLI